MERIRSVKWHVVGPVGLLAIALAVVAWFDLTTGGEAEQPPLLGEIGTPVRSTYVAIPPTTVPTTPTPQPRPSGGEVTGTPEERDGRRRTDLVLLAGAFQTLYERDGGFPTTGGNTQTLCVFKANDVGCAISEILGEDPPWDPLGDPANNGYFYRSDGETMELYAQLEADIPPEQECETDRAELRVRANLICVRLPA